MTMPKQVITEYFDALARLQAGRPTRVPKGTTISNDSVALEAGRGKGSIKKSRPVFLDLIHAISVSAAAQSSSPIEQKQQVKFEKMKAEANRYRNDLETVTGSLVSRIYEIHELKKKVRSLEEEIQLLTARLSFVSNSKVRVFPSK